MTKNTLPNFGITLEDMVCFNGVMPDSPNQNRDALSLIRDGIELFEIPKEGLGIPLEILQQANSVNVLALYLGLGYLMKDRHIPIPVSLQEELNLGFPPKPERGAKKVDMNYDMLLKRNPSRVVSALNNFGWDNYTGIRWYRDRGFAEFGRGFAERIGALSPFVLDRFMGSLSEARKTHYAHQPDRLPTIGLIVNLLGEVCAAKNGEEFFAETDHYKIRRLKTRSTTRGREGRLYVTREFLYNDGNRDYSCTCPARVECRHIKEMKAQNR